MDMMRLVQVWRDPVRSGRLRQSKDRSGSVRYGKEIKLENMLAWFGGLWSSVARFASVGFGNVPYGLEIK